MHKSTDDIYTCSQVLVMCCIEAVCHRTGFQLNHFSCFIKASLIAMSFMLEKVLTFHNFKVFECRNCQKNRKLHLREVTFFGFSSQQGPLEERHGNRNADSAEYAQQKGRKQKALHGKAMTKN